MAEEEVATNNPAGRLYRLLSLGKKAPSQKKIRLVWADILGVPEDDRSLLVARLSHVLRLPSQIRTEIEAIPVINHAVALEHLPKIENALRDLNLEANWNSFSPKIDDTALYGLKVCADHLSRHRPEPVLDNEEIADLLEKIRELQTDIRESDLEEDIAQYLLEHLDSIEQALIEHAVAGLKPVEEAAKAAVGDFMLRVSRGESPQRSRFWSRFDKIVVRLLVVLTLTDTGLALADRIGPLALPPGEPTIVEEVVDMPTPDQDAPAASHDPE